jgi:hypothetical protein
MYTYNQTEFDVAVILTRDELHDLRYLLRNYLLGMNEDDDPKFVNRVAFWHSVLSSPVPDKSWYEGTDEEDDDDAA